MVIARKIAFNVLASSISKIISTILALVVIGFITRYLGKDGFGNYATVLAFLSFFSAFFDLGLNTISTREISREGADEEKIMGNIFALRICTSVLAVVVSPVLVLFFNYPQEVKEGIMIISATFVFTSAYQVLNGVFQKKLSMDKVALSELIGKVIQVILVVSAVKSGLGFNWIIGSILVNMIVTFLMVFLWSKKYIKIRLQFNIRYWRNFLRQSFPMGVAVLVTFVYFKMDTILISIIKTSSDVGIYGAAYKVIENISFFPAMIVGLVFPIMSQNVFSNPKKFREVADKTFKFFLILIMPLVIATLFLSENIINVIGGSEFHESSNVLRILIFALAFIFLGNFSHAILISGNQQKKLMIILSITAAANVISNLILIPRYSYLGAAYVSVFTEFFVVVTTFYIIKKSIGYVPKAENGWAIVLASFFMAGILIVLKDINIFLLVLISLSSYIFLLWLFRAVKTSEILSIISRKGLSEYENVP